MKSSLLHCLKTQVFPLFFYPSYFAFAAALFFSLSFSITSHAGNDSVPEAQLKALRAIYNATGGNTWLNKNNWLSSAPVETWHGVTVRGGQVSGLDLSDNNLTGNMPAELLNLPALRELRLGGNRITAIAALPNSLSRLDCAGNLLNALPALPALLVLNCSRNGLTALPELPASLRTLDCSHNQLTTLPALPSRLGMLDCRANALTSLPELPAPLERLTASENKLTFGDLTPAVRQLSPFSYAFSPQDSVGTTETVLKTDGENLTLSADFAGSHSGNRYQWFRNGHAITEPVASPLFTIPAPGSKEAGVYTCQITNTALTAVTGLTLHRRPVTVVVESHETIKTGADSDHLRIYPNPFRNAEALRIQNTQGEVVSITVVDTRGRVVYHTDAQPAGRAFSLESTLARGNYLLRIKDGTRTEVIRVVKLN